MSDRIVNVDGVCGGQPVIRGTRVSVLNIVSYMESWPGSHGNACSDAFSMES